MRTHWPSRRVRSWSSASRCRPPLTFARSSFRRFLGERFLDCLDRFDALLTPGVPWEAPAEDPAIDGAEGYGEMLCSAPTNLCGLPRPRPSPAGGGKTACP